MKAKEVLLICINIIVILLLVIYLINPGHDTEFTFEKVNGNFSVENKTVKMQFYENMRFPSNVISYSIDENCSLQKYANMKKAFDIVGNETDLEFYEIYGSGGEIFVTCEEKTRIEDGLFIAGEGGPTNITEGSNYKVILRGEILLIKDSECSRPNVEIHELLHVLGFDHSENKNNILYPITKCKQTLGDEIPELINELYSKDTLSDLMFERAEAQIEGRVLHLNLSIRNDGLKVSDTATIGIYSDDKLVKDIPLKSLKLGHGVKIELKNLWLTKAKMEELKIVIESEFEELDYSNNEIILKQTSS